MKFASWPSMLAPRVAISTPRNVQLVTCLLEALSQNGCTDVAMEALKTCVDVPTAYKTLRAPSICPPEPTQRKRNNSRKTQDNRLVAAWLLVSFCAAGGGLCGVPGDGKEAGAG